MSMVRIIKWLLFVSALVIIYKVIMYGYSFSGTGFGAYTITKTSTSEIVPPKFVWDWLELLIIPVILVVVAYSLNRSEEKTKREIAEKQRKVDLEISEKNNKAEYERIIDRQREESLEDYIDKMSELLVTHQLKEPEKDIVADVARAKTLATVRTLDGVRKGLILKFLYDSGLINGENPIIDLQYADFRGTEYKNNAFLGDANLTNVDFENSVLVGVEFNGANLTGTNFRNANISNGKILNAEIDATNFEGTNLEGITFQNTNFSNIIITNKGLVGTKEYFRSTVWRDCQFESCAFENIPFHDARFIHVDFKNHHTSGGQFIKSYFDYANFDDAIFIDVDFTLSEFNSTSFIGADLYNAKFDNALLVDVNFSDCKMNKVSFVNAKIHFEKKIGEESKLPDSNFTGVTFCEVKIDRAQLSETQLNQIECKESNQLVPTTTVNKRGSLKGVIDAVKKFIQSRM